MIGQSIDRYVLVERLGSGGMGDVYKGHLESLDQYRAIKILPPHLARNPELVERFFREARRCAGLNHPNVVRLEHVGEQDGTYFMVMDYVSGTSLRALVENQAPLPVARGVEIARQVCLALAHAHARGVIHRDVKPSNILVDESGRVVLTDFGIARALESDEPELTEAGATIGTPEYMSPEQVRGESLDGRSDLYSLGIVLYEMFTGELPFSARSRTNVKRQQLDRVPDPPRFHNPDLPESVEGVILKALSKEPAGRFGSAEEMEAALAEACRGSTVESRAGSSVPRDRAENGDGRLATAYERATRRLVLPNGDGAPAPGGSAVLLQEPGANGQATAATVISAGPPAGEPPRRGTTGSSQAVVSRVPALADLRLPKVGRPVVAAAVSLGLALFLLQGLGSAGSADHFSAEQGTDPRNGKEFGIVRSHGVGMFVITEASGDLTPAQRAEKAAERLQQLLSERDAKRALTPERIVAMTTARGETVVARRAEGARGKELDPDDVIVKVDADTAKTYASENKMTLARWWRDLIRDHVRLARGKPPVSTFDTEYGKILDRVYQQVEDDRKGDWVPASKVEKAIDDLTPADRKVLDVAWRSVPDDREGTADASQPENADAVPVARKSATATDAVAGFSPGRAVDGNSDTAWESRHGIRYRGRNHSIRVNLAEPSRVTEVAIVEGARPRSRYQLRVKQAKIHFSDGTWARVFRETADDPLRVTVSPRTVSWVKVEVEQVFANPEPHESHLYIAEVKVWG